MKAIKNLLKAILWTELFIGALLVIAIVMLMCMEIFMRYVMNDPIVWVQECVLFFFIIITAIGASVAVKTKEHIQIDTVVRSLPLRAKEILDVLVSLAVIGCLVFLAQHLPRAIEIQNKSNTSSLPVNFPRGFYYSVPILVSVYGMVLGRLYYLYYQIRTLFGLDVPEDYAIRMISSEEAENL